MEHKQTLKHKAEQCPRIKKKAMKGISHLMKTYKSMTMSLILHRFTPKQIGMSSVETVEMEGRLLLLSAMKYNNY